VKREQVLSVLESSRQRTEAHAKSLASWPYRIVYDAAVVLLAACSQATTLQSHRAAALAPGDSAQVLFNDGWLFAKEDITGAEAPGFDDRSWRKLDLPHDWSIEGPFDSKWASCTAFLPAGVAWYRKHFTLSAAPDQTITLRFDGVYENSTVYLNGRKLGDRPYGFSSFEYTLTPNLKGGDNVVAVRVDHGDFADSRWYTGSGIYRNVYLTATSAVHVDRYGVYVTTGQVSPTSATINVGTSLRNDLSVPARIVLRTRILDAGQSEVANVVSDAMTIEPKSANGLKQTLKIPNPVLWSVDHPVLYTAITEVTRNGVTLDAYSTPFGIRECRFDPDSGFSLNGQSLKLKGVCIHEEAGALGSAVPRQVWERRLDILREAGVNAIRTSHNPPAPEFLDLCDRLGFLVMDEAFDEWSVGKKKWMDQWNGFKFSRDGYNNAFGEWSDRDLRDMVLRDRNHPSIIMWCIGNEIDYPNDPYPRNSPEPARIAARLIKDVKALDTSRPVTAACASIASNLFYPELDIVGYNYQEFRYADDHAKKPRMVIYGSENSHRLAAWLAVENNPYISGQFLWTGADYLGEAHAWPNHANPDGIIDLAGFPKPVFFFRQSLWSDTPMVHIEPGRRGLVCYTNGDSVEFFRNGQSLGAQPLPPATRIIRLPAADNRSPIKAIARKNGQNVAEDLFTPAGAPVKILLSEYKTTLGPVAGPNVAQVELAITDAAGIRNRDAAADIAFRLEGPGRLLAIESGDVNSTENPHSAHRKAFHGRLVVYVETHGSVTLTAQGEALAPARILIGD
jgi:beta-galactosidase/beta-glucuronidase